MRLHVVTFEDLRDLGLSVNEATRVLSYRHRGELTQVSDLETLPGLSHRVREMLTGALDD